MQAECLVEDEEPAEQTVPPEVAYQEQSEQRASLTQALERPVAELQALQAQAQPAWTALAALAKKGPE